jgi:hypothetical protein
MASTKTYMLVPHHDFPADGPIALGSIIYDLLDPGESVNENETIEIPADKKYTAHKYDWEQVIESTKDGRGGIWARCLIILGLGGNVGATFDTITVDHYRFQDLETAYFSPTRAYIEESVDKPGVRRFLEGTRYAPMYMVTGLKTVRGPGSQVTNKRSMVLGGHSNIGRVREMGSSPLILDSGDAVFHRASATHNSFGGSTDFVIGYRLCKITF